MYKPYKYRGVVRVNLLFIFTCCRYYEKLFSKWFPQNSSPECLGTEVKELNAQSCAIRIRDNLVEPASCTRRSSVLKDIDFYLSKESSWTQPEQDLSEFGPAPTEVSAMDINKDILEIDQFLLDGTMFHESTLKCENFQDLKLWCSTSQPGDTIATDSLKTTTEDANVQTPSPTLYSPQLWNRRENGMLSPFGEGSFYPTTPREALSPTSDILATGMDQMFAYRRADNCLDKEANLEPDIFDITNIPVILACDEFPKEEATVSSPGYTDRDVSNSHTQYENSTEMDLNGDEIPSDVITWKENVSDYQEPIDSFTPMNNNETVISEYVIKEIDNKIKINSNILLPYNSSYMHENKVRHPLRLNIRKTATKSLPEGVLGLEPVIGTPDILNCVEQLEAEKFGLLDAYLHKPIEIENNELYTDEYATCAKEKCVEDTKPFVEVQPVIYKTEPLESDEDRYDHTPAQRRRRRDSEDSDETYTPIADRTPTKTTKKRKAILIPPQEPKKVKRGRPPKQRDSLFSTCMTDNSESVSIEVVKYRELRDKNNIASKRSRFNRKQKEQEMEELGTRLEERNKKLRIKAEILEELTKKLKDALLTGMLGK